MKRRLSCQIWPESPPHLWSLTDESVGLDNYSPQDNTVREHCYVTNPRGSMVASDIEVTDVAEEQQSRPLRFLIVVSYFSKHIVFYITLGSVSAPHSIFGALFFAQVGHLCGQRTIMYAFLRFFVLKASKWNYKCGLRP